MRRPETRRRTRNLIGPLLRCVSLMSTSIAWYACTWIPQLARTKAISWMGIQELLLMPSRFSWSSQHRNSPRMHHSQVSQSIQKCYLSTSSFSKERMLRSSNVAKTLLLIVLPLTLTSKRFISIGGLKFTESKMFTIPELLFSVSSRKLSLLRQVLLQLKT